MPEARIASVHDLADGEMMTATVGDTEVLVSRVDGRFYACGARCTHYGAPLANGALHGRFVVCPWHQAEFDVTTGALATPPALDGLSRYHARVEGDAVFVRVPEGAETTPEGATYRESEGETPAFVCQACEERTPTFAIVGGGAAGQAAAEALRQAGFGGRLVLVTKEDAAPYDRTMLSKGYLSGDAGSDALPLRDDAFFDAYEIEVLRGRTVTRLDASEKTIYFEGAEPLRYDKALVATGGTPRTLGVPGADADGVFTLRTAADADRIAERAEGAERAVVIGSGFIGMEAAASLTKRGLAVTVVSTSQVPFENVLGEEVGGLFQQIHEENGVTFCLGSGVEAIEQTDAGFAVRTEDGQTAEGDLVVVGIGVVPATDFLEGVTLGDDGGVIADAHLAAGSDLWVAGDIAQFPNPQTGERVRIEHWQLAQQHGRIAARNMAGQAVRYESIPFFWSGQFGTNVRYLGHAEGWDAVHIDGDLGEKRFIAYYLKDSQVLAAAGVGRDREMTALRGLILAGETPTADEVREGVDLLARLEHQNAAYDLETVDA
ncbi:MAG: FAD-dependent oxidoreductase [Bacteroidota bacterium]